MHTYVHMHTSIHIHTCIHMHTHVHMHKNMQTCDITNTHTCLYTYTHVPTFNPGFTETAPRSAERGTRNTAQV